METLEYKEVLIYDIKLIKDKNQNNMALCSSTHSSGNIKILIFSSTWRNTKIQDLIKLDNIVLVRGKRSRDALILDGVELLECQMQI